MWEEKKNKENVSVRRKRIFAAILLYFCLLLFVANDAWVYQTPIVKITEVHTKESRKEEMFGEGENLIIRKTSKEFC